MSRTELDETLPEEIKAVLRQGAELEEIRLDRHGRWHHQGTLITHRRIVDLLNTHIERTPGGSWLIRVGEHAHPIVVEDTPYFVRWFEKGPEGILVHLSDGTSEPLDPGSISYEGPGRLYCKVKQGKFRARFQHAPYHDLLVELTERRGDRIVLDLGGHVIDLGEG
jgi:hypothetical protein